MRLSNLTWAKKNGFEIEKKVYMVENNCVKMGSIHFKTIWNKSEFEHLFMIFVRSSKQNNVVVLACVWVDKLSTQVFLGFTRKCLLNSSKDEVRNSTGF